MLTELSRFAIAIGYAIAAGGLIVVARKYRGTTGGDHALFATVIAVSWSVWYAVLAVVDPPISWGFLNRALHIPVIAFLLIAVWTRLGALRDRS